MTDVTADTIAVDAPIDEAALTAEMLVAIHSLREQIKIVSQIQSGLTTKIVELNDRAKELRVERQHERTFATYRSVNSARRTAVGLRSFSELVRGELDRLKAALAELDARRAPREDPAAVELGETLA